MVDCPQHTVEKWLLLNPGNLVYKYFNVENISFTEEILQELDIKERIVKPGIDHVLYEKYKRHRKSFSKLSKTEKGITATTFYHNTDHNYFSKKRLQSINHGKV